MKLTSNSPSKMNKMEGKILIKTFRFCTKLGIYPNCVWYICISDGKEVGEKCEEVTVGK